MNIFYLHRNPLVSAAMQCDKHVVKMILETAQLLSTAHRVIDGNERGDDLGLYKLTHQNHPSAVWVRSSSLAYSWTWQHLDALLQEYTRRYGKIHKTTRLLGLLSFAPLGMPETPYPADDMAVYEHPDFVEPPMCMPDEYQGDCTVQAYRSYYQGEKAYMAKWKMGAPNWWNKKLAP